MPISVQSTKLPSPSRDRAPPGRMYKGDWGLYSVLQVPPLLTTQRAPQETGLVSFICKLPKCLFKKSFPWTHTQKPAQGPTAPAIPHQTPNKGVSTVIYSSLAEAARPGSRLGVRALRSSPSPSASKPPHTVPASSLQSTGQPPVPHWELQGTCSLPDGGGPEPPHKPGMLFGGNLG